MRELSRYESLRPLVNTIADLDTFDALRVFDCEEDRDPSGLRVVTIPTRDDEPIRADEYTLESLGERVSDLNPDHPADSPIVTVVYESDLDRRTDPEGWRAAVRNDSLAQYLADYADEWQVSVMRYTFPSDRLHVAADQAPPADRIEVDSE